MTRLVRHRSAGRRRALALGLLVAWVGGFELLPNLHVALHGHLPSHHHAGDSAADDPAATTRVVVSYSSYHSHPDGYPAHHHHGIADQLAGAATPPGSQTWLIPAEPSNRPGHGTHSLAHRGLATVQPPPIAIAEAPVVVRYLEADRRRPQAPSSRRPLVRRVRGPPALG